MAEGPARASRDPTRETKMHSSNRAPPENTGRKQRTTFGEPLEPCSQRKAESGAPLTITSRNCQSVTMPKQELGGGFRPSAIPDFQFPECTDLRSRVKRQPLKTSRKWRH